MNENPLSPSSESPEISTGKTEQEKQQMNEPRNFHSIIGPNGMCECGVLADGTVVRCGELLESQIRDAFRAGFVAHPEAEAPQFKWSFDPASCSAGDREGSAWVAWRAALAKALR